MTDSRFQTQNATAEDLLKSQTVGLVKLEDFRKRRAEVLDQQTESDASHKKTARSRGKKSKKSTAKSLLSFDLDGDSNSYSSGASSPAESGSRVDSDTTDTSVPLKRARLHPSNRPTPKNVTKSALAREAKVKEELRREYLIVQEIVKATEVMVPFVFYEGSNKYGGAIRMKKGEQISLFLERARKVGVRSGQDNTDKKDNARKGWARMSTDELMLVRGDMIIPHVGHALLLRLQAEYLRIQSTLISITSSSTKQKASMVLSLISRPNQLQPLHYVNPAPTSLLIKRCCSGQVKRGPRTRPTPPMPTLKALMMIQI